MTKTNRAKPHHYTPTMTNNVNKTSTPLQTTEGKDESIIVFMRKSYCTFDSKSAVSHRRSYCLLKFYKQPVYIQCYFTSLMNVYYWLFCITWPVVIFDSMTCDGVNIDHVIDMTKQYWLHSKLKLQFSSLEFQKSRCAMFRSPSWIQFKFCQIVLLNWYLIVLQ